MGLDTPGMSSQYENGLHLQNYGVGAAPTQASGFFTFGANPDPDDPMPALNGVADITFVGDALWPQVERDIISLPNTLTNLAAALQFNKGALGYEGLAGFTYTTDNVDKLIITADVAGSAGNAYTLGASTANIVRSAATLEGGTD